MKKTFTILSFLMPLVVSSQLTITGTVHELNIQAEPTPLIGVNIRWIDGPVGASTDVNGNFEIGRVVGKNKLIFSYVGFQTDTITVNSQKEILVNMVSEALLNEVEIKYKKSSTEISYINPIQTSVISQAEICKAACCSLSESFETSPSVDVSFTDAVTGTRQIKMLGLSGKYVQLTRELIPDIRVLAAINGLTHTPGPWIESIQLSKGTGSVLNGYESMTGQINVELRKPQVEEDFYLNLFANQGGRYEANLSAKHQFNKKLSTSVLLHTSRRDRVNDMNQDGFMEMPNSTLNIFLNRWYYTLDNGMLGQIGIKLINNNGVTGQVPTLTTGPNGRWTLVNTLDKKEAWIKAGKIFKGPNNRSIGLQLSYSEHEEENQSSSRPAYIASQNSLFANLIYQQDIGEDDLLKGGFSYSYDEVDESFGQSFYRQERVPGAFAEYAYKYQDKVTIVAGIRADMHNEYGLKATPRLHMRYAITENSVLRFVSGKGWRTANLIAETPGLLATNRSYAIQGGESTFAYGLAPEESWNVGGSLTQKFDVGQRTSTLSLDYYYTTFTNQIVPDWESALDGTLIFANQGEPTKSHSMQVQYDVELIENLDIRVAYRYNINSAVFGDIEKILPFNAKHRAFANLGYEGPRGWWLDYTLNWNGEQRLPSNAWLPDNLQREATSPDYFVSNTQIRKVFNPQFELYMGAENLWNFTQANPIIDVQNPFSDTFDATQVWGPIFGRNVYLGLRYKIQDLANPDK